MNALELLGMVMSAYMLVVVCGERPVGSRDCVLLRGGDEAAVHWVRHWRGGKEPLPGTLVCLRGAIELAGGWHFDSLHVPGVLNDIADDIPRWNPGDIYRDLATLRLSIDWQERDLGVYLLAGAGGDSDVRSLLAYIAYAWGTDGLTAGTIAGHLAAVKLFHRQERGLELFLRHPWIVDALKGVTRSHAEAGTKSCIRRPIAWSVLLTGDSWCHQWGPGGRVLWLSLGASFFFLARAGETFASKEGC